MNKLYSFAFTIPLVIVFDLLLASNSIVPMRLVYDISFAMIMFVMAYISVFLLRNKEIPTTDHFFAVPRIFLALLILLNLVMVFVVWQNVPDIGSLSNDLSIQGANSLLPLLEYLLIITANSVPLYIIANKKSEIRAYELPTYAIGIVSIQVCLAAYGFYVAGATGIQLCISLFHIGMCGVILWLYRKSAIKEIRIKFDYADALLLLLSAGILMMVFLPYGIYNLFGDSSVIVGSANSISKRGSLLPYYHANGYYSATAGFVSITFAYLCSLNNILLASNIPFLASYLMLPFVTYFLLKKFVTNDSSLAIMGTIIAILMDGLAILLLPAYQGSLTLETINFQISGITKSLYASTTTWLWSTPYKTFGLVSSIAMGNVLKRKSVPSFLLSGALFAMSFTNPRQPFVAILILIFLFGISSLDLKHAWAIVLSSILSMGPLFYPVLYELSGIPLWILRNLGIITLETSQQYSSLLLNLTNNALLLIVSMAITAVLLAVSLRTIVSRGRREETEAPVKPWVLDKKVMIKFRGKETEHKSSLLGDAIFLSLSVGILAYAAFSAYQMLPAFFTNLTSIAIVDPLNYLVLRYHILIVLIVAGFFAFIARAHTLRMLIALAALAVAIYVGLIIPGAALHAPVIIVIMALPMLGSLVKTRRRTAIALVLLFVILGVFSASMYSATVKSIEPPEQDLYNDLPHLLSILATQNSDTKVYFISSYDYFVRRVVQDMGNLRLTTDPSSCIYIIDRRYSESTVIESLLDDNLTKVLYYGHVFILLERIPKK